MFLKKSIPVRSLFLVILPFLSACQSPASPTVSTPSSQPQDSLSDGPQWLAGDHHIHGKYSAKWDLSTNPPTPILRGDAQYATAIYAQMAKHHNLSWMVTTDHGGPNHSELNLHHAYPELLASRQATPEVLQFYGMEFDTPGARHCSLIIPYSDKEAMQLYEIEKHFNRREIEPDTTRRDTNAFMLSALKTMQSQEFKPLLIVNHPSRMATAKGEYKKVTPAQLRSWQDIAPDVVIGMEGAPGHQANALNPDGSIRKDGKRGGYNDFPTMGGFDQMTAIIGGTWDSLLGEGRKWWITSTSDSHMHYTEGRTDFWPGEYSKTYVYAQQRYDRILQAMREGKIFVTTGDLIDALSVELRNSDDQHVDIGGTLVAKTGSSVRVKIRFRDPQGQNFGRRSPSVRRVDLIGGMVSENKNDPSLGRNPSTRVIARFTSDDWQLDGEYKVIETTLSDIKHAQYIRIRGTNQLREREPEVDPPGEDPWSDLWFYSNPVFIQVK